AALRSGASWLWSAPPWPNAGKAHAVARANHAKTMRLMDVLLRVNRGWSRAWRRADLRVRRAIENGDPASRTARSARSAGLAARPGVRKRLFRRRRRRLATRRYFLRYWEVHRGRIPGWRR